MSYTKTQYGIAVIFISAVGLIIWGGVNSEKPDTVLVSGNTNIPCLPDGHTNVAQHIHQMLSISVNGTPEIVPGHIGDTLDCMAEVHTHDTTGKIHVETIFPETKHTLVDFFTVWGTPIDREGYTLTVIINGIPVVDPASHVLVDDDVINLSYISK